MIALNKILLALSVAALGVAAPLQGNEDPFRHVYEKRQQGSGSSNPLQVDLGYTVYQGTLNAATNIRTWFGVRYARAPTGSLRWQAPQAPVVNRTSVVNATTRGPQCPQNWLSAPPYTGVLSTEDCLYLDVYSPANANNLPVFIYIHGGGYGFGNAGNSNLNYLMGTNNNSFVGVVIQYRLGAFGFLASDEVSVNGVNNAGLLDQHFALQWVQQYIASFGGDPRRVSLAGESAGAGSVLLQSLAYGGTEGDTLFTNAIVSSPYLPQQYECSAWIPSQNYYAFASKAGCFSNTAVGNKNETVFQCLVRQDSVTLQYASFNVSSSGRFGTWAFAPCTDGVFIQEDPVTQLIRKKVNGRNLLVGQNADEGAAFVNPNISTIDDLTSWLRLSYPLFSDGDIAQILQLYPNDNQSYPSTQYGFATTGKSAPSANNVSSFAVGQKARAMVSSIFLPTLREHKTFNLNLKNIFAESNVVCPSYWFNEAFDTPSHSSWHYQYSVPAAEHIADLYILLSRGKSWQSADFITALRTIWGNFISTGNPSISNAIANGASVNTSAINPASAWPRFNSSAPLMLNLNSTGGTPSVVSGLLTWAPGNATVSVGPGLVNDFSIADMDAWEDGRGDRCEFWRSVELMAAARARARYTKRTSDGLVGRAGLHQGVDGVGAQEAIAAGAGSVEL